MLSFNYSQGAKTTKSACFLSDIKIDIDNSKNHSELILDCLEFARQNRTIIDLMNPFDE